MARAPGTVTHGSAKDLADHDEGYSPNGESVHSRRTAAPRLEIPGHTQSRGSRKTRYRRIADAGNEIMRVRDALIACAERDLEKLREEIRTETSPSRRNRLQANLDAKSRFVEKVKSEAKR